MIPNIKVRSNNRAFIMIFVLAVVIVSFLSLWRALEFHFWRDDWGNLWELTFHPKVSVYFDNGVSLRRHPGLAIEKVIGNIFFGQDIYKWQFFGIFLRIINALTVTLMIYGMTNSRKAAMLSGLFMASAIGGLESVTWLSAHTSVLLMIAVTTGMYFWVKSYDLKSSVNKLFFLALLFFSIGVFITPAAGQFVIPMAILWDVLTGYRRKDKTSVFKTITRGILIVVIVFGTVTLINSRLKMFTSGDLLNNMKSVAQNSSLLGNYFSSLGNLSISWIIPANEPISLGVPTQINQSLGRLILILMLLVGVYFLIKRTKFSQLFLFFLIWILLFYFPNWMYEKGLVVGSSHRYLTNSAIGMISLVGVIVSKFKKRYLVMAGLMFVFLNINASNKLLADIAKYRSFKVIEPIWEQIDEEVERNTDQKIFIYEGNDLVWGTSMSWSGSVPFGIKRKITNADNFPIVTSDPLIISKLLCEESVYRPTFGGWVYEKERITISNLYAWKWDGTKLNNISIPERDKYKKEAPCKVLP